MGPREAPSSTVEFIGGPCDGLVRKVMDSYRVVRVRTDSDPPMLVPNYDFAPPDLPHLGTYERDPWVPSHFIWKG